MRSPAKGMSEVLAYGQSLLGGGEGRGLNPTPDKD